MGTCFRCGRFIPSTEFKLRRKVKTGEWVRRRYPNPEVSAIHTHWGVRVVCLPCAKVLDREEAARKAVQYLELAAAVALLLAALVANALR